MGIVGGISAKQKSTPYHRGPEAHLHRHDPEIFRGSHVDDHLTGRPRVLRRVKATMIRFAVGVGRMIIGDLLTKRSSLSAISSSRPADLFSALVRGVSTLDHGREVSKRDVAGHAALMWSPCFPTCKIAHSQHLQRCRPPGASEGPGPFKRLEKSNSLTVSLTLPRDR